MTYAKLRDVGTTGTYAPNIKRSTMMLSSGRPAIGFVDTNRYDMAGEDSSSATAKLQIYVGNADFAGGGGWFKSLEHTPSVAFASPAKQFIGSFANGSGDRVYCAYAGLDNSVHVLEWSGFVDATGLWGATTDQTALAGNAVANRIRAIDVAVQYNGSSNTPAFAIYEANANGLGAWVRVYVRLTDGVTWVKAYERQVVANSLTVKPGGEDVSIAFIGGDIAANVARIALYYTQTATTVDSGDRVEEITFNVASGTTNSATFLGAWYTNLNKQVASGQRRGWLFPDASSSSQWVLASAVGASAPFFEGIKLKHSTFTGMVRNRMGGGATTMPVVPRGGSASVLGRYLISQDANAWASVAATFSDNRLIFTYAGLGDSSNSSARMMVMRWPNAATAAASYMDASPRMLDNGYGGPKITGGASLAVLQLERSGVIGVYGGFARNIASGRYDYPFAVMYGDISNKVPMIADHFNRTVASGDWGKVDWTGQQWTKNNGVAADFSVGGGNAKISNGTVNVLRQSNLNVGSKDGTYKIDVTIPVVPAGTGAITVWIIARMTDASNYYVAQLSIAPTTGATVLQFQKRVGGTLTGIGSGNNVGTHAAGNAWRVVFNFDGSLIQAKAWNLQTGSDPGANNWHLSTTDTSLASGNIIAAGTRLESGNTNTLPVVATFDGLQFTPKTVTNRPRELRAVWEDVLNAPTILSPASSSIVGTNTPALRASYQGTQAYPNVYGRIQYQLATDSAFTTNVRTMEDANARYESLPSSVRTFTYQMVRTNNPLFTGTWYMRARMMDDLGESSAWSSTVSFSVSHPPVTLPIRPTPGTTLKYGDGNVIFNWKFTDPEPGNTQGAYQILVERQDDGTVVVDTGKVTSSSSTATVAIDPAFKDVPLQWRVCTWDNEDGQGAFSDPIQFFVADPPTATLTSPTQGQVVTTALPVFAWNFAAGGARTQRAFRITVYDVTTSPAVPVAESGWQFSTNSTYMFPAKILNNNKIYTVALQVQDSSGLYSDLNTSLNFKNGVSNSGFETNTSGWSVFADSTQARSTLYVKRGFNSLELTTGAGANPRTESNVWDVTPGEQVRAWAWALDPIGTQALAIRFNWLDENGVYQSTSAATAGTVLAPGVWTLVEAVDTAPAGSGKVDARLEVVGTPGTGYKTYWDEVYASGALAPLVTFVSDWIEPPIVVPTLTVDPFKIKVAWTDALKDSDFVSWRVYRRYMKPAMSDFDLDNTANTWVLVYETDDQSANLEFYDYLAPLNKQVDYAVVQMVDRFGSLIESFITSWATTTQVGNRYYFIPEVPIGMIASFEASGVVSDSFQSEVEQEDIHVVGRGRQVQVGDDMGYTGSLGIHLWNGATARRDREFLELLASGRTGGVYLKSPFGDVLHVKLKPISVDRQAGRGTDDIVNITVPYLEVIDDVPPVTRTA